MQLRRHQLGLSMWGWSYVLGTLGLIIMVAVKSVPIVTDQMAITKALNTVAADDTLAKADAGQVRRALQRFWDIEDIKAIKPIDVKVKRTSTGRALVYAYEARVHLFYNVDIVYTFADEVSMVGDGGA